MISKISYLMAQLFIILLTMDLKKISILILVFLFFSLSKIESIQKVRRKKLFQLGLKISKLIKIWKIFMISIIILLLSSTDKMMIRFKINQRVRRALLRYLLKPNKAEFK
jgi:hypothetical protein